MRVGIVVPRYGHTAVERNRLKRRLRELVRGVVLSAESSVDVVVWAQRSAYSLSFAGLQQEVERVRRWLDRGERSGRAETSGS